MGWIPLSMGVPIGVVISLGGVVLFLASRRKSMAVVVIAIGALITLGTLMLIVLAVNSNM